MRKHLLFGLTLLAACRVTPNMDDGSVLRLSQVEPSIIDPQGGSRIILSGSGFLDSQAPVREVRIGGLAVDFTILSDTQIAVSTPPLPAGDGITVRVKRGDENTVLDDAVDVWSPAQLPGARLFDAASGVATDQPTTHYEWQRLTPEIGANWRVRDGNTLTWLPSTNKFWMVGGWNGYQEPEGFSTVDPDLGGYPMENTSDEVWSSPDGVTWTLELPHQNGQFERRHSHNTVLWKDQLWMIGGDAHQGYPNHDIVSSADGVHWTVQLGPLGAAKTPPWSERILQVSGVYNGRLWTAGGQNVDGVLDNTIYHNDVWVTDDGINWTQVVADAPGSETRWAGCGVMDGLVEFKGEMWLVGCARERADAVGHSMSNEVWSTTDGITWRKHATPPWAGKIWHNVVVWDGKLWALFGYTYGDTANGWPAGNATEVWYSEDGETWRSLPADIPAPGSHAQGIAVTDDFLLYAGGNYSFGFGLGEDKSAWRMVPFRGDEVTSWSARGAGLVASAREESTRPVLIPDAFGPGAPGLHFDGSVSALFLDEPDVQESGRSVFWVARAPYLPVQYGWEELYSPSATIVGGPDATGYANASVGLSNGQILYLNRKSTFGEFGEPLWSASRFGGGLQEGPGQVSFAGLTHTKDGVVQAYINGGAIPETSSADHTQPRAWSRIGTGVDGVYERPYSSFGGTLGAVIVLPEAVDEATVNRIHEWAQGRFGAP